MEKFTELGVISARTCVYEMMYRLIWTVHDGRCVLEYDIELFIQGVLRQIADEKDFIVHSVKVLNKNYIDVTVSAHPKIAPSYIVKMLKGISGRKIHLQFPDIKQKLEKGMLWTNNFYIQTIGDYSEETVEDYIKKQFKKTKQ